MLKTGMRSKVLAAIVAAGLFQVFLPADDALACACCGTYKVVGVADWDVLNVRTGPGVRFHIKDTLNPGEGCIIQTGERRGNWVRVEARGDSGWVHRRYLGIIH